MKFYSLFDNPKTAEKKHNDNMLKRFIALINSHVKKKCEHTLLHS